VPIDSVNPEAISNRAPNSKIGHRRHCAPPNSSPNDD
jgi:hypothetical protein